MTHPIYHVEPTAFANTSADSLGILVKGDEKLETFQAIFQSIVASLNLPSTMATSTHKLPLEPGYAAILYLPPTYPSIESDIPYVREINRKAALAGQLILDQKKEVTLHLYRRSLSEKDVFVFKPSRS